MDIKYFSEITEAAERYDLDPLMVASIVRAESNFNPKAISNMGAKGLMQLMPGTDKWLDNDIDGFDIEGNLDNGCMFLDWLRNYFTRKYLPLKNGHSIDLWKLVWAGYNAGPGNIRKMLNLALEEGEQNEAYKFSTWKKYLPKITGKSSEETINYIVKITKFWREYVNEKEAKDSSDPTRSIVISKKRLSCILIMVEGLKREVEQLVDEVNLKEEPL